MENVIIREAGLEDLDGIVEIEKESFATPWPKSAMEVEIINNKVARYLVAEQNEEVLGYIGIWLILNEGHITNIAVRENFRRHGIGDMLMVSLIFMCETNGIDFITLEVRESNLAAQKFYEKHGFKMEGLRKGYYRDNDENAIIMNRVK